MDINRYDAPIKILTPVHIGSNDSYTCKEIFYSKEKSYRINIIKLYNSLSPSNQEKLIKNMQDNKSSLNDILGLDSNDLKKYSKYTIINKYFLNKRERYQEFESCMKSNNKLYIPGSSIRGFIKTALFYKSMKLTSIPKFIKKFGGEEDGNYWTVYENLFSSKLNNASISNNILRFLHVTDSTPFEGNAHLYKVIRLYSPDQNARRLKQMDVGNSYFETIPECDSLKTSIIINFDEKIFSELNFNRDLISLLDINTISNSLALLSEVILNFEIQFFSRFGRNDIVEHYKKISEYNYYNKPLILLGGGTGFHTKSIYLKILDFDDKNGTDYSTEFCNILFEKRNNYMFPKSRRILFPGFKPLGWAQLDLSEYI